MSAGRSEAAHTSSIVEWRRAALAAMQGKARALTLIAVLPVVLDKDLKTRAGNAWFMTETALDQRSVQYGLEDLKAAGLIEVEIRGPRRTISAVLPGRAGNLQDEQSMRGRSRSEGEQSVHARLSPEGEQSKQKARTKRSPIEDRSPPYPPRSRLPEFQQSRMIARQSAAAPWQPGTVPGWASDDYPLAVDAGGAAHAAPEGASNCPHEPSSRRAVRGRAGALP